MKVFDSEMSNIVSVTKQLLRILKIKVNDTTLTTMLEDHPSYPSLLSISDCLTELKVPHQIYRIEKEQFDAAKFPFPFITHFAEGAGRFVLITGTIDNQVKVYEGNNKNVVVDVHDFLQSWSGIILNAYKKSESGEQDFNENHIQAILKGLTLPALYISILCALFLILIRNNLQWPYILICATKLIGVTVSILLLMQSIGLNNPLIRQLCSATGNKTCNTILNSDAAKITRWLSWSEVGLFYFSGTLLVMVIIPDFFRNLFWLSLSSLPFMIFSLTYQYKKKVWCILCCTIQALLASEIIIFLFITGYGNGINYSLQEVAIFILCFTFSISTWGLLKPLIQKNIVLKPLKRQLNIFKYNGDLFRVALSEQPYLEVNNEMKPIILGNHQSETTITIVSNPFCRPCTMAHHFIDKWLQERDDIQVKLLFANENTESDSHTKVARHMIALGQLNDESLLKNALNEWYNQNGKKSYELWAEKYPVCLTKSTIDACDEQKKWCKSSDIAYTPTVLINGYKLPDFYAIEDLRYLIN